MALIGMAVYCTPENKKENCLEKTLDSLLEKINWHEHRIGLSINATTDEADIHIGYFKRQVDYMFGKGSVFLIHNESNIGTARAINKVWQQRRVDEHAVKMDDDIVVYDYHWLDKLCAAVARDSKIGQIGLKRKDCWETPWHEKEDWRSELKMLPHVAGEEWIVVEKVKHVIGSCVLHSSALLDKVGYLFQPSLYGYDDVIMSHRSYIAGFYSCFLPEIRIDHIDDGNTPYQSWKEKHSSEQTQQVIKLVHDMYDSKAPIYYNAD